MRKFRSALVSLGALLAGATFLAMRDAPDAARIAAPSPIAGARSLFISGHSLTAPLAEPMNGIAPALNIAGHSVDGSTIRQRLDAGPAALPAPGTDILLVTEQHRLLDAMTLADTVGALRELDERFHQLNSDGTTVFYVPWADLSNLDAPGAWIDFERRAAPVWACLVQRAGGEQSPIRVLPASLALADLVAELVADPGAHPGFEGATPRAVAQALFTDNVHPSELGAFFLARVSAEFLLGSQRASSMAPPAALDPAQARTVADFASRFATERLMEGVPSDACAGASPAGFVPAYTAYMETAYGDPNAGGWRAGAQRIRHAFALYRRLFTGA